MCAIVAGPDPPRYDAYIEWHWMCEYKLVDGSGPGPFCTGKFIFVAPTAYLQSQYAAAGNTYAGFSGNGIGIFNPSNHNQ
jgi:hypothetical protein